MNGSALVVGGGIAGVSAAAFLAESMDVTLAEAEPALAYHATGRSAALLFENYGAPGVRPLTAWSRGFFEDPPPEFDRPLLRRRGALTVARDPFELDDLVARAGVDGTVVERIDGDGLRIMVPALRDGFAAAVYEPEASDLDVAAIHQGFVRLLRRRGGDIWLDAPVSMLEPAGTGWEAVCGELRWRGDIVINAAGAWGDVVAALAGVRPLGLIPKRRTAFMVAAPDGSEAWPLVVDVGHTFYFKPDGPQLLCSPADETPQEPGDARPRELDVALAIERINAATTLGIRSVRSQWAGLRTFTPDADMAIGWAADRPGFCWLVGQGGTGIQTAPGAARVVADLVTGRPADPNLAPGRFA